MKATIKTDSENVKITKGCKSKGCKYCKLGTRLEDKSPFFRGSRKTWIKAIGVSDKKYVLATRFGDIYGIGYYYESCEITHCPWCGRKL